MNNPVGFTIGAAVYFALANISQVASHDMNPVAYQQMDDVESYQLNAPDSNGAYPSGLIARHLSIFSLMIDKSSNHHVLQLNEEVSERYSEQYKYLLTTFIVIGLCFLAASRCRKASRNIFS